ncbi:hypothetical protein WOLCODRAFT_138664 [Wolfiporia cocos MD-104 SS10]|uniref:DUF7904 domain-containing protein n=1 Tax=Wolfiporia cocos (strain MD-104) TaxID=742152 RepID=A0A2H3JNZ6_WOLCO|nr:hypothetical protein WOLCODRAFT_138664 [Wolfiporia cocos MD-104 SS10]
MESSPSAAHRRIFDLPSKPEAGLAEWASKIKAMQRQVDEDEELEHKRLEEEIQASRMARLRRSAGNSQGSIDLSTSEYGRVLKADAAQSSDNDASTSDRQQAQDDALRKLTGVARAPSTHRPTPGLVRAHTGTSAAPMSLAAFMGGKATGPRLTRHAPQQDAHDPTQFEQRTSISSPHPVFGRGGVAMPGMVGRAASTAGFRREREKSASVSNNVTGVRGRRLSTSSAVKSIVQKVEEEALAAQKTGSPPLSRKRTNSIPSGNASSKTPPFAHSHWRESIARTPTGSRSISVSPGLRSSTPNQDRSTPTKPHHALEPMSAPPKVTSYPDMQSPLWSSTPLSTPPKPSITTPSLAKPIQRMPRPTLGPQLSLSHNPSPAFLRAPPPKDPTPSISRLQGRGFVRSMVQASSQLSGGSPSVPPQSERSERKDPAVRKSAPVLERWQSNVTGSAPSPPVISPKPAAMRKPRTADPSSSVAPVPTALKMVQSDETGRSSNHATSSPSAHADAVLSASANDIGPEPHTRPAGVGSATTMISYIKPIKTGDGSAPNAAAPAPWTPVGPGVDELGMRVWAGNGHKSRSRSKSREGARAARKESKGGAGKPLSHLTKDRARKPRKARGMHQSGELQERSVNEESGVHILHSETPALPGLISAERVPEHVVTLPTDDVAATPPGDNSTIKPASPPKNAFDDDFAPTVRPHVPVKPPQLTDVVIPPPQLENRLSRTPSPNSAVSKERAPASPARHRRIPSTGNRATVMDVAQAFQEQVAREFLPIDAPAASPIEQELHNDSGSRRDAPPDPQPQSDVKAAVANLGNKNLSRPEHSSDKRKSSYERYSAIIMPPLPEEKTPVASPAGTLSRMDISLTQVFVDQKQPSPEEAPTAEPISPAQGDMETLVQNENAFIHIDEVGQPLPEVDIPALLQAERPTSGPDADVQTISVEVMSVVGNSATAINQNTHIFYDSETLAVIHRAKSRSTGLASTKVWAWRGKNGKIGEREEKKLHELARRYGTTLVMVHQYCEPDDFVIVLGGQLVTRQGTRTHWSSENTAMHLIRTIGRSTFVDEVDLNIKNLCSAFSYCASLLGTFYVWYGCGSVESERRVARDYALSLASAPSAVVELTEGESDDDEMFWMILGDGDYAKADYWRWRSSATQLNPRVWSVGAVKGDNAIAVVPHLATHPTVHDLVHIVDCIWEFFVLIGSEARGKRNDIRLALSVATRMSELTASSRPFAPTVHVLILPSQIPTDLRLHFRDLDETELNQGNVPDHMNLIPAGEATEHLRRTTWGKTATQDPTMLPLGVHTSDLSDS